MTPCCLSVCLAVWLLAFAQAVALQLFVLRQAGAASQLASVATAATTGLAAAAAALGGYASQFLAVAGTAAAAGESHALLQRCQATLGTAAAQEQQLTGQAEQGRAALTAVLAEAQPVAAQALASLHECQVRAPTCTPPMQCLHMKVHKAGRQYASLPACLPACPEAGAQVLADVASMQSGRQAGRQAGRRAGRHAGSQHWGLAYPTVAKLALQTTVGFEGH